MTQPQNPEAIDHLARLQEVIHKMDARRRGDGDWRALVAEAIVEVGNLFGVLLGKPKQVAEDDIFRITVAGSPKGRRGENGFGLELSALLNRHNILVPQYEKDCTVAPDSSECFVLWLDAERMVKAAAAAGVCERTRKQILSTMAEPAAENGARRAVRPRV